MHLPPPTAELVSRTRADLANADFHLTEALRWLNQARLGLRGLGLDADSEAVLDLWARLASTYDRDEYEAIRDTFAAKHYVVA